MPICHLVHHPAPRISSLHYLTYVPPFRRLQLIPRNPPLYSLLHVPKRSSPQRKCATVCSKLRGRDSGAKTKLPNKRNEGNASTLTASAGKEVDYQSSRKLKTEEEMQQERRQRGRRKTWTHRGRAVDQARPTEMTSTFPHQGVLLLDKNHRLPLFGPPL